MKVCQLVYPDIYEHEKAYEGNTLDNALIGSQYELRNLALGKP